MRDAAHALELDLELLGLVGIEDPPRPGVAAALRDCRRAGIHVGMITGDHRETAAAIARQIGLAGDDIVALDGDALPASDEALGAAVHRDGIVLARVSPEDKLRIARALAMRGHVVAMTGDGVNDGPASSTRPSESPWGRKASTSRARRPTWCSSTTTSPPSSPPSAKGVPPSPTSAGSSRTA